MSKEIDLIFEAADRGEIDVFEVNKRLAEQEAGYYLDPWKNRIHRNEPENIYNGVGMMDTGTGTMDKVRLVNGKLTEPAFNPDSFGADNIPRVMVLCGGETYYIAEDGVTLTEDEPAKPAKREVLRKPDMRRKKEYAGTVQRQYTAAGTYDVTYNEDGYGVKATRV